MISFLPTASQQDDFLLVRASVTGSFEVAAFPTGKAAIHQNHGLFTVGQTVDEAVFWFVTMERTCQAQLAAMAAGTPKPIRHEWASYTSKATGSPFAGWFSFQPLWDEICASDPELFE